MALEKLSAIDIVEKSLPSSAVNTRQVLRDFEDRHMSFINTFIPWLTYLSDNKALVLDFIEELSEATHQDGRKLILDLGAGLCLTPIEAAGHFANTTIIGIDKGGVLNYVPAEKLNPILQGSIVFSFSADFNDLAEVSADRIHWMSPDNLTLLTSVDRLNDLLTPGGYFVIATDSRIDLEFNDLLMKKINHGFQAVKEDLSYPEIHRRFGFSDTHYHGNPEGIVTVVHGTKPIDRIA